MDPAFPSHGGPAPSEAALRTSAETQSAVRPRHCTAYATATATPRAASGLALRASLGSSASSPARLIAARKRSEITCTGYVRDNGRLMWPWLGGACVGHGRALTATVLKGSSRGIQEALKGYSRAAAQTTGELAGRRRAARTQRSKRCTTHSATLGCAPQQHNTSAAAEPQSRPSSARTAQPKPMHGECPGGDGPMEE